MREFESHTLRMKLKKVVWISAAHILLDHPKQCSRLHGHNFKIEVIVEGDLNPKTGMLVDFGRIKEIIHELDHKMLIPEKHKLVKLQETPDEHYITMCFDAYRFPKEDCVILPYEHVTAENIAKYISYQLAEKIDAQSFISYITIRVHETPGNSVEFNENFNCK